MNFARDEADFPHAVGREEAGGYRLLVNPIFGISVVAGANAGSERPVPYFKVSRGLEGETEIGRVDAVVDNLAEAQVAYAAEWMRAAAAGIGLGFHPDTPAAGYEPPLEPSLATQYDAMIEYCHRYLDDPYAIAMDGWEQAGLVASGPTP